LVTVFFLADWAVYCCWRICPKKKPKGPKIKSGDGGVTRFEWTKTPRFINFQGFLFGRK